MLWLRAVLLMSVLFAVQSVITQGAAAKSAESAAKKGHSKKEALKDKQKIKKKKRVARHRTKNDKQLPERPLKNTTNDSPMFPPDDH